ncbi:cytochrome P450 705A5 [Manihot esculenta]|uniref:Cytochrome P450 n=1 Tax=Manihot esculenta TaxID=3983 RepID=A0A2C9V6D0_MANES|nr:cytochrome P450 705A5 [Manihot esculenta]
MATINGDTLSYLNFFFLSLISSFLLLYFFKKPTKPILHLPPSPPSLPLIGHLHLLGRVAYKYFHNLATKHGPLLSLQLGSVPLILVSSASYAAEIFKTNDIAFSYKPKTPFDDGLLFQNFGFISAPYGDYWRFMKKLCMTELLGPRQTERSSSVRREELQRFLQNMVDKACKNENVDLENELVKLTNNTICRMAMSTRCSEEEDEAQRCKELVDGSMELAAKVAAAYLMGPLKKIGFWVFREQLKNLSTQIDELLEKILKEHEERAKKDSDEGGDQDLMDILLKVYQDEKAEFQISRSQMKAFFVDLFIAGTHTTADSTHWIMAMLINHPKVFKKLREEIESVVGKNRLVEESDISKLHYLQAIVKETLRLYPLGPLIPRTNCEDCKIGGFDIPKETIVLINLYSIMRDPNIWDNPDEFKPERFLVSDHKETNKQKHLMGYVPFGGGRRMCPGSHLGLTIIHVNVASMVQCFDWKVYGGDGDGGKVNVEAKSGMIMCMAHPLVCLPVVHYNPFSG